MHLFIRFRQLLLLIVVAGWAQTTFGQRSDTSGYSADHKWFIALPLRFTYLQNSPTLLSGIRLGHSLRPRLAVSLSVYHSFYLKAFKAEAGISGFEEQPRLFINGAGAELQYHWWQGRRCYSSVELFAGWGFMKYDLKQHDFVCKPFHYAALEPAMSYSFRINETTGISLGVGYRMRLPSGRMTYTSALGNGEIPVNTGFPNGVNVLLSLNGFF